MLPNAPREKKSNGYIEKSGNKFEATRGTNTETNGRRSDEEYPVPRSIQDEQQYRGLTKRNGERRTAVATCQNKAGMRMSGNVYCPKHLEVPKPRHAWEKRRIAGPKQVKKALGKTRGTSKERNRRGGKLSSLLLKTRREAWQWREDRETSWR